MNIGYLYGAIFFGVGAFLAIAATVLAYLLNPPRKTKEKLQAYESGEVPIGTARTQYPLGFYIFALLFVVFDVDIVFITAWALVFKQIGISGFLEIVTFILILALGLIYAWRKGMVRWI